MVVAIGLLTQYVFYSMLDVGCSEKQHGLDSQLQKGWFVLEDMSCMQQMRFLKE